MKRFYLCLCAAVIIISSCTTSRAVRYVAPAPDIPYFKQKGDAKADVYYSRTGKKNLDNIANGADANAALAVTDFLAVTGAFSYSHENTNNKLNIANPYTDQLSAHYNRWMAEAGAGAFIFSSKRHKNTFNLYAGIRAGRFFKNEDGVRDNVTFSRFFKATGFQWYLQPSFNLMPGQYFRAALYTKISFIKYFSPQTDYALPEEAFDISRLTNRPTLIVPEIGYNLHLNIPGATWFFIEQSGSLVDPLQSQLLGISAMGGPGPSENARNVNISIGIGININELRKK